jgi:peptidoglycan/LPS O-acetylase OafA/YrhL
MHGTQAVAEKMPGLDLLRAMAIIWVMLFHSFLVGGLGSDFEWLSHFGWMGVDIFFVLSGFLIGSQVLAPLQRGEPLRFGKFYERRAWRILPAFAVVLAIYVFCPPLREEPGFQPWWQFATFSLNFLIDYTHNQAFSHAWSLCVEEHFYLVFPVLAWWLARRRSAALLFGVMTGMLVLGIALRIIVWQHDAAALDATRNWFIEDIYYPTWMRLDGLLMGVVLATLRTYRPGIWARMQAHSASILLVGLGAFGVALWLFRDRTGLLANAIGWPLLSGAIALVVFVAAHRASLLGRWRVPGAQWIAAISYGLYLSHKLAIHAVNETLAPDLAGHPAIAFAIYSLAVLLCGAMLHYAVERPGLAMRDRREKRKHPVQPLTDIAAGTWKHGPLVTDCPRVDPKAPLASGCSSAIKTSHRARNCGCVLSWCAPSGLHD